MESQNAKTTQKKQAWVYHSPAKSEISHAVNPPQTGSVPEADLSQAGANGAIKSSPAITSDNVNTKLVLLFIQSCWLRTPAGRQRLSCLQQQPDDGQDSV